MSPPRRWLVRLGCAATLVLLAAVFLGGVWAIRHGPSAEITLSGGTKLRFLGTTYGTNHVAPGRFPLMNHRPGRCSLFSAASSTGGRRRG
jgi:hypothetical protein